ncbi:Che A protein Kinase Sensory transduction transferase Two-component regulatory system [Marine Group I thaumarchaeote SCGC AAA799-E16]|uniref:Che A protein Kinase Sensory transduction transferase Two-component regulatory system n=5 Tax=Marine Group I TaxID=905826 RepID=A0A081RP99_9ARCH|nr:Che A protein Kinase Sensory transduction transferase Two-component regulatory system [Marine Group I thaumarchaeote SCGC AAA799-N04]KER06609.1 Che A protein Kinase Sensory transduction transferase Two-component regulatory system [Marine Group I thaumarchaeote SCGC AAA799-E16]KFM16078.1 Che A protein Kinase Sensory transduction transferase Two-component regulatory system [Marine Group I thaumarchaeote SCGC AAA799-D11]KFM17815.1 Hpt domain protein [Marine Group I thaumarchaeote SCGC RSA3]
MSCLLFSYEKTASIEYKSNGQILAVGIVMSDEFIKLATNEINEELSGIGSILNSCSDDAKIFENSDKLQKHTHKIKGLAPMMGKHTMGNLATVLDDILKQVMAGKTPQGIFDVMTISHAELVQNMNNDSDLEPMIEKVKNFLNDM